MKPRPLVYHVVPRAELVWDPDDRFRPASLATEGFAHASYREQVEESARLYFPAGADLFVLVIDPTRLDVKIQVAETPRGPMPHVHGAIPRAAVTVLRLSEL